MDLDIEGDAALVASSSGLGKASATALAREGVDVVINGRGAKRLETAAGERRGPATSDRDDVAGLVRATVDEFDSLEDALAERAESVLLGRVGKPMELGDTVAFLSSPRSGLVNGQSVVVDGGSGASNR
jgi:NAD(P)-dependent dehydrogenase (short-subunit alcohol dehydrogenase family)